ncbi:hypothetical protein F2P81_020365 [Scophthalmus maximus]|uniref:Uncharacterized protein n=1 Tax=Scophthalmus maximus TaxID=52904 RepID=A0A6A4SA71_SCOMX|nr:hypothetical protein F2P81_020365 [Scophthalmus maximus]
MRPPRRAVTRRDGADSQRAARPGRPRPRPRSRPRPGLEHVQPPEAAPLLLLLLLGGHTHRRQQQTDGQEEAQSDPGHIDPEQRGKLGKSPGCRGCVVVLLLRPVGRVCRSAVGASETPGKFFLRWR